MIYKYFKINENSISNLVRNELYCQNYKSFNDPFECWFILKEGIPRPEKERERFESVCKAWGYQSDKMDSGSEDYFLYMEELETYQPDIQGYVDRAKISCFSKEVGNLLMWSHYANGLRGFCVEFDEKLLLSEDKERNASIIPVSYIEQPPVVDKMLYSLANDQVWYNEMALEEEPNGNYVNEYKQGLKDARRLLKNLYKKTIASKPIQWKYEKEVRLIIYSENDSSAGEFFHFPSTAIKSVIVGEKIDAKFKETISQIIDMKRLPILKKMAKRNPTSYQIEFEPFN